MTAIDFIVLIPVVPAIPILATWWLPWERWIPWRKLPLLLLGPWLLYGAFVAWYFKLHWWAVLIFALPGSVITFVAVSERIKERIRRGNWD
jgi:hypothetical protein